MFNIFKKQKKGEENKTEKTEEQKKDEMYNTKIKKDIEIHTLPKKFYFQKLDGDNSKKAGILLILAGTVLIIAIAGAMYFYMFRSADEKVEGVGKNISEQKKEINNEEKNNAKLELYIKNKQSDDIMAGEKIIFSVRILGDSSVKLKSVDFATPDDYVTVSVQPFQINVDIPDDYKGNYMVSAYGTDQNGDELRVSKKFVVEEKIAVLTTEEEDSSEGLGQEEEIGTEDSGEEEVAEEEQVDTSIDSDSDGLKDVEEELFGTDKDMDDTDGDGYLDKEEILNLYNPVDSNKLTNNINITKYVNKMFSYSVLSLKSWKKKSIGGDDSWLFKINDEQFVQIVVQQNVEGKTIEDWYNDQFDSQEFLNKSSITKDTWSGIISGDGLSVYLTGRDNKNIIAISYNFGNEKPSYKTVFDMMVNSFEIK